MLNVVHLTSVYSRGHFERLCVELDLSNNIVPKVILQTLAVWSQTSSMWVIGPTFSLFIMWDVSLESLKIN